MLSISHRGVKEGSAFGSNYLPGEAAEESQDTAQQSQESTQQSTDTRINQIYQWFEEDILVKNIDGNDVNTITHCNSDISSFSSANCESIGGYFDNDTQECKSINIKVGQAKEDDPPFIR